MLKTIAIFLLVVSISVLYSQDDPLLSSQWNLTKIMAPSAWNITTGSSSIIIAILDDGVDSNHPDLQNKLVTGYDVADNDNTTNPYGSYYHGTACAGIAAAQTNNGIGIAGVGYNCKIMPIQLAHDDAGIINPGNFVAGLNWAVANGASIICFSGHTSSDQSVLDAIDNATTNGRNGKGCVFVKSAGNDGSSGLSFPGTFSKVLSVGASNSSDSRVAISSYGPELDVMAPAGIYATDIAGQNGQNSGDYYNNFENTSSAAPQVAGLAGLIISLDNTLSEQNVRKIICYSCDDINLAGFDNETGWGRINAWRALDAINHRTTNGTLPRDEIWYGTINLSGNVTVPTGVKLTILSGTVVNMGSSSIIASGGTINSENGVIGLAAFLKNGTTVERVYSSIQTACNAASNNYTVEIQNGTFTENISVTSKTNLTIKGRTVFQTHLYGTISAYNSSGLELSQFDCDGVYLNNCSDPELGITMVGSGSGTGLNTYNCSYMDIYGMMWNFSNGFAPTLSSGNIYANTEITENSTAINATQSSNIYAYYTKFCGSINYDLQSSSGAYILAYLCYYNNATPRVNRNGGYIDIGGTTDCSGLLKSSANIVNSNKNTIQDNDPVLEEFKPVNKSFFDLSKKVKDDITANGNFDKNKFSSDFTKLIDNYKAFINKNPNSILAKTSLTTSVHSYRRLEDNEGMKMFLQDIIADKKLAGVSGLAKRFMIDYYIQQKDFNTALNNANQIIDEQTANKSTESDKGLIADVLFAKALILVYNLNQPAEAIKCLTSIIKDYPVDNYVDLAKHELSLMGYKVDNKEIETKQKETVVQKLDLNNYPNPFNPTTNISFSLPQRSNVKVVVYDALGREVTTLANSVYEAGKYSLQFNGSNLASGMYFYTLTTTQGTITKKMLLIK
jgi:subtilisin family serine protease